MGWCEIYHGKGASSRVGYDVCCWKVKCAKRCFVSLVGCGRPGSLQWVLLLWSLSTCIALKRGGVSVGGEGIPLSNQNRSAHLMHYHEEKKPRSEYMENSFSFLLEKAAIWTFLRCVLYIDRYLPLHEHRVRYLINSLVDWQLRLVHNTVLYVL